MAARALLNVDESLRHFGRAIELATEASIGVEVARTRVSRAGTLALLARHEEAVRDIDAALEVLGGTERAEVLCQKATILAMMGRFGEALTVLNRRWRGGLDAGRPLLGTGCGRGGIRVVHRAGRARLGRQRRPAGVHCPLRRR